MKKEIYKVCSRLQDQKSIYSIHDTLEEAMKFWSKACSEYQDCIDVYIEKHTQITEVVVARRNVNE